MDALDTQKKIAKGMLYSLGQIVHDVDYELIAISPNLFDTS